MRPSAAALACALLAACAGRSEAPEPAAAPGPTPAGAEIVPMTEIGPIMQTYYQAHAVEENGRCDSPSMQGITGVEELGGGRDEIVLLVDYAFEDPANAEPLWAWAPVPTSCSGTGERRFVLVRDHGLWRVERMSGPGSSVTVAETGEPPLTLDPVDYDVLDLQAVRLAPAEPTAPALPRGQT